MLIHMKNSMAKPPGPHYSYGKGVKAKLQNLREVRTMDSEPCAFLKDNAYRKTPGMATWCDFSRYWYIARGVSVS